METFTTKLFVNDANALCKAIEKYAYGWTHYIPGPTELKKIVHQAHVDDEDDDAVECINHALDTICDREGEVAEITLPMSMRRCSITILQACNIQQGEE